MGKEILLHYTLFSTIIRAPKLSDTRITRALDSFKIFSSEYSNLNAINNRLLSSPTDSFAL